MSVLEALLHPSLLGALALYALLGLALLWVEHRWLPPLSESAVSEWIAEHVLLPAARIVVLLAFIGAAYPVLFSVADAPSLHHLLSTGEHRIHTLINLAFLVSLAVPLLPVIGSVPGVVLPMQGIAASALLFAWTAAASGIEATVWPGGYVAVSVLAWAALGHRLAVAAARLSGEWFERWSGYSGSQRIIYESIVLFLQAPSILLYTLSIGRQL